MQSTLNASPSKQPATANGMPSPSDAVDVSAHTGGDSNELQEVADASTADEVTGKLSDFCVNQSLSSGNSGTNQAIPTFSTVLNNPFFTPPKVLTNRGLESCVDEDTARGLAPCLDEHRADVGDDCDHSRTRVDAKRSRSFTLQSSSNVARISKNFRALWGLILDRAKFSKKLSVPYATELRFHCRRRSVPKSYWTIRTLKMMPRTKTFSNIARVLVQL